MRTKQFFLAAYLLLSGTLIFSQPKAYYVAVGGLDANTGAITSPFATLTKAASTANAGDTIYVRGGKYNFSATVTLSKSGTEGNLYKLYAYKQEKPVFDFTAQSSSDGIKVNGSYWHVKGIESSYAAHNGIAVNGSYNTIENCSVHDNRNSGLQLSNGAAYNRIINCDSYYNYDPPAGGNADGFSPKLDVGTGNYFYGCRSWQNSDDGFDGYLRPSNNITTTFENCWSFMNGYLKDGSPISTGNGNGFKMGGSDAKDLRHNQILKNCLCFDNRVKGFDQNNNKGSMTLYNCTSFRNGTYNFSIPLTVDAGFTITIANSVSLLSQGVTIYYTATQSANTWIDPFSVSSSDFITIDTTGVRGPRKADGSLPDVNFMHLVQSSRLIDAGVNLGIPYSGNAPDLGAFEYNGPVGIENTMTIPRQFSLYQNYPNPFNPSTTIKYSVPNAETPYIASQRVTLKIYDLLGRNVSTLVDGLMPPGNYAVRFDASHLPSGIYLYTLQAGQYNETKKMMLLK